MDPLYKRYNTDLGTPDPIWLAGELAMLQAHDPTHPRAVYLASDPCVATPAEVEAFELSRAMWLLDQDRKWEIARGAWRAENPMENV